MKANYIIVVEDRPIMFAKYCLPVTFGQNLPTQQSHGLFVTAEVLVTLFLKSLVSETVCRSAGREFHNGGL